MVLQVHGFNQAPVFIPFSPVTVSQIWPLLFYLHHVIVLIKDISPLTWTEWPHSGSFHRNSWTFQAVFHSSFQNHLPPVSMGSTPSPSRSLPLSFSTPSLYLPTCTSWLASHFTLDEDHQDENFAKGVLLSSISPGKMPGMRWCSVDKHVKWMNNGGIEIDVPVKIGDINQKQS